MATGGGTGPPNSPVAFIIGEGGEVSEGGVLDESFVSQYEPNMVAEQPETGSGLSGADGEDEKMLKLVAKTVE
eukprot:9150020-Karenia_brevis.AAC.1